MSQKYEYRGDPYSHEPREPKHHRVSMFGEFLIVLAWVAFMAMVFITQPWVPVVIVTVTVTP